MDLSNIKYWEHPSKTKCVFVEKKDSPLVSIDIWCKAGILFEEKDKDGIAHFLEHMIFKGSKLLKPGEFDFKIESLGGLSNASTGYDDVHYYVDIPSSNLEEALYLLTNLVFKPNLNINEFELEKEVVIEEIMQNYDQKDERIFNHFLKRVWLNSPYSKSILGSEENIRKLNLNELIKFHQKQYIRDNTCIAIAGDLPKNLLDIMANCKISYLGSNQSTLDRKSSTYKTIRHGRELFLFDDLEFSRIIMALGVPRAKEKKHILGYEILSSILTDGRNSILNRVLKEDLQIVESVYTGVHSGEYGSLFIIEASCREKYLNKVERTILNLLEKSISTNDIIQRKDKAIRIIKSNYFFNLESSSQLASFFGNNLLWGRLNPQLDLIKNLEYWEKRKNIEQLTDLFNKDKFTFIASKK